MKKGKDVGRKVDVRGYWLDILIGPFVAFGVEAETDDEFAKDLFRVLGKTIV